MKPYLRKTCAPYLSLFALLLICFSNTKAQTSPTREFRAVWIATVDNIDWPSKKGLTTFQQQEEFVRLLDFHQANGINAVIMQIRPAADAFFPSKIEPWSEW